MKEQAEDKKYNEFIKGLLANRILPDFSKIFGDESGIEKSKTVKQVKK